LKKKVPVLIKHDYLPTSHTYLYVSTVPKNTDECLALGHIKPNTGI